MDLFLSILAVACEIYALIIFFRAILSWFAMSPGNTLAGIINAITEPVLAPLRRVIPQVGTVDITPAIAIVVLLLLARLMYWL